MEGNQSGIEQRDKGDSIQKAVQGYIPEAVGPMLPFILCYARLLTLVGVEPTEIKIFRIKSGSSRARE